MSSCRRGGFSLLEVLLASAILLGSVFILAELSTLGSRSAAKALEMNTAQMICQTKLNEILAGAVPVESEQRVPLEEYPGWVVSVEILPASLPNMRALRVTAARETRGKKSEPSVRLMAWMDGATQPDRGTLNPPLEVAPSAPAVESAN